MSKVIGSTGPKLHQAKFYKLVKGQDYPSLTGTAQNDNPFKKQIFYMRSFLNPLPILMNPSISE